MSQEVYRSGKLLPKEIEELSTAVSAYQSKHSISAADFCELVHQNDLKIKRGFWSEFKDVLPQRRAKNVREYMRKAYLPSNLKQPFTDDDLSELARLVNLHGQDWSKIGSLLHRYREHCQHAYVRLMDKKAQNSHGSWLPKEEAKLEEALRPYGDTQNIDWQKVATQVGTRTPIQCSDHHRARYRKDYTYSKGRKRIRPQETVGQVEERQKKRKPNNARTLPRSRRKLVKSKSDENAETKTEAESESKSKSKRMATLITDETVLSLVHYLQTLPDNQSIDHLRASDLSEWLALRQEVDGVTLVKVLTTKYKKIRHWRSLSPRELLKQVAESLGPDV